MASDQSMGDVTGEKRRVQKEELPRIWAEERRPCSDAIGWEDGGIPVGAVGWQEGLPVPQ